jgi:hypothetical protein
MVDTIALVLDGEFAERLAELIGKEVWVIASPTNLSVIHQIGLSNRDFRPTPFEDYGEPLEEAFDEILATIDLHYGPLGQDPPISPLEVFGVRPNHFVRASLQNVGFEVQEPTADGFTAIRSSLV